MVRGKERNAMCKTSKNNPFTLLGRVVKMLVGLLCLVLGTVLQAGCEMENVSEESNENQV